MALSIYKPEQGYWTRMLTAVGVGALVLAGVAWLINILGPYFTGDAQYYVSAAVAVVLIAVAAGVLFWVLNKPRVVDFMIATEAEMRKVSWPSRREVIGSTWVVICGTFLMALLLFLIDIGFASLFQWMGVLEGGGS